MSPLVKPFWGLWGHVKGHIGLSSGVLGATAKMLSQQILNPLRYFGITGRFRLEAYGPNKDSRSDFRPLNTANSKDCLPQSPCPLTAPQVGQVCACPCTMLLPAASMPSNCQQVEFVSTYINGGNTLVLEVYSHEPKVKQEAPRHLG